MHSHYRDYYSPPPDSYRSPRTTSRYDRARDNDRGYDRDYEYESSHHYSTGRNYDTGHDYSTSRNYDTDRHYLNPRHYNTDRDYYNPQYDDSSRDYYTPRTYDRAQGYPRGEDFGRLHLFGRTRSNTTMSDNEILYVYHYRYSEFNGDLLVEHGHGRVTRGALYDWLQKSMSNREQMYFQGVTC